MQASISWSPPGGVLGSLLESTRERVRLLKPREAELIAAAARADARPSFGGALRAGNGVAVIAEIKRSSPSKGAIAPGLSALDQAGAYAAGGAAAISVLTEPSRFGGSIGDLVDAKGVERPLLRKDFIIDRLQMVEAVASGASATLLIARALPPAKLAELHAEGLALGLELLVEVHDEDELAIAIAAKYPIVGVNNRDLVTLEIDAGVGARLIPQLPSGVTAVYESGVRTRADVERAAAAGADAVLVGSALSSSRAAAEEVRGLVGVPRQARRAS